MCNLSDAIAQQGRVEGRAEGYDAQARMVEKYMKETNRSQEEAFAFFELSDIEKNAIRLRLQSAG